MGAVTEAQFHPELAVHIDVTWVGCFASNFTDSVQACDRLAKSDAIFV
jgi:hypothetical protein